MAGQPATDHRHLPDVHVHGDETLRTPLDALVIGGGQAGLAAGYHLRRAGLGFLILEAGAEPVGSWPAYYDSLTLFSPARYSALPGLPFPGDPDHYPDRDEIVAYLRAYASHFTLPVVPRARVERLEWVGDLFTATTTDGRTFTARGVIAATGGFSTPHRPALPGQASFTGAVLHTHEYRRPEPFAGQRVVVVGSGNSAVQVAAELAGVTHVTLASRTPLRFRKQRFLGRDFHFWLRVTGLDTAPFGPRLLSWPELAASWTPAAIVRPSRPVGPTIDRCSKRWCPRGSSGRTVPASEWTRWCSRPATARALITWPGSARSDRMGTHSSARASAPWCRACTTSACRSSAASPRPPSAALVPTRNTSSGCSADGWRRRLAPAACCQAAAPAARPCCPPAHPREPGQRDAWGLFVSAPPGVRRSAGLEPATRTG